MSVGVRSLRSPDLINFHDQTFSKRATNEKQRNKKSACDQICLLTIDFDVRTKCHAEPTKCNM